MNTLRGKDWFLGSAPLLMGALVWGCCSLSAGDANAAKPDGHARKWAVLIGCGDYACREVNDLPYTVNDVHVLTHALVTCGDYQIGDVLEICDDAEDEQYRPTRGKLMAALPQFLAKPGPEDHVLVYFSGHGFCLEQGKEKKLFLAPLDCDPKDAAATGIAVAWLRDQLSTCRAKVKLLVLDACHAGTEKDFEPQAGGAKANVVPLKLGAGIDKAFGGTMASAEELGRSFKESQGIVTLASSTSDERSLVWNERQQSLFSYWLRLGLKGHADQDSDGIVTIDEVFKYLSANVPYSAQRHFRRKQTPVRIIRSDVLGVPEMVRLKPLTLREVLNDMAEQLAWAAEEKEIKKIGVLEFTNDSRLGELLGADFGQLGRYCAEELERKLVVLGRGKFNVVDRRRLQSALKAKNFRIDDLGKDEALKELSQELDNMPALVLGKLSNRRGRTMSLHAQLTGIDSSNTEGSAGGTVILNDSEWAMIGQSAEIPKPPLVPPVAGTPLPPSPPSPIDNPPQEANRFHPLQDSNFLYPLKIMARRPGESLSERPLRFRNGEAYVALDAGDVFEVYLENRSRRQVLARLLVDGQNSQAEEVQNKMFTVEGKPTPAAQTEWVTALRVNLDEATPWILDPKQGSLFAIRGFFAERPTEEKPNVVCREFTVEETLDSPDGRNSFTDQLGLITAAFYDPKPSTRGPVKPPRVVPGNPILQAVKVIRGVECGPLRAVVHIRYVSSKAWEQLPQ
jgi:uncharacterized caspase-like protein